VPPYHSEPRRPMAGVCSSPPCGAQITANVWDGLGRRPGTDNRESELEASELGELQFWGVDEQPTRPESVDFCPSTMKQHLTTKPSLASSLPAYQHQPSEVKRALMGRVCYGQRVRAFLESRSMSYVIPIQGQPGEGEQECRPLNLSSNSNNNNKPCRGNPGSPANPTQYLAGCPADYSAAVASRFIYVCLVSRREPPLLGLYV
jgi:hypothetical protein